MIVMAAATSVDPAALAVHRPLRLHAAAGHGADRRMGVEERHPQSRDARLRLRARHRRGEDVRQALHRRRAARSSNRCARRLANPDFAPFVQRAKDAKADALFVFVPSGAGSAVMKQYAERGLRSRGHAADLHRRRHRRRHPRFDGRTGARRRQLAPLFGRASVRREQGVRRRVHAGERRHAAELHVGRRLRRHAR